MPKYKFVKAPLDYPGKVYTYGHRVLEHHLVWWRTTGKTVPKGYVLHHKNEDTLDNRFANLELLQRGDHTARHHLIGERYTALQCKLCGKVFKRTTRYVREHVKQGQKHFFCCSSHAAKFGHAQRERVHGTPGGYGRGCRCRACKDAHAEKHRKYRRSKKNKVGP